MDSHRTQSLTLFPASLMNTHCRNSHIRFSIHLFTGFFVVSPPNVLSPFCSLVFRHMFQVWFSNRRAKWRRHQRMSNSHSSKYSSINGSRDSRDSPVDISRDDSGASRDSFETTISSDRDAHQDEDLGTQVPQSHSPDSRRSVESPEIDVKNGSKSGSPVLRMGSQNSAFKKIPKD